ncbi:MAG TPA: hypothetical protein PKH09_01925 [Parvularculaceae bacterium]|nr:hypothetical protein [Parvularculaceae bacterium]
MFEGRRRTFALLGLAAFAALIIIWGIASQPDCAAALSGLQKEETKTAESNYSGSVTCERDCQVTFGLSGNANPKSGTKHDEVNDTCDTPAELDLIQQMAMSHWAKISAILAMLGFFGVLWTFKETHDMGQIQTRAYVSVVGGRLRLRVSDYSSFEFDISVRNTGQSPAFEITIDGIIRFEAGRHTERHDILRDRIPQLAIHELGGKETITKEARIGGDIARIIVRLRENTDFFSFSGTMQYRDVYGLIQKKRFAVGTELKDGRPDDAGIVEFNVIQVHPSWYE